MKMFVKGKKGEKCELVNGGCKRPGTISGPEEEDANASGTERRSRY